MAFRNITTMIQSCQYDCLILSHPECQVLDETINHLNQKGFVIANLSFELSKVLMTVPMNERSRFTVKWIPEYLSSLQPGPVICAHSDLLFEPVLMVDPLAIFRQVARISRLVILWLGDFNTDVLFYAIPAHQHYRTWRISDFSIHQPKVVIQRIPSIKGAHNHVL